MYTRSRNEEEVELERLKQRLAEIRYQRLMSWAIVGVAAVVLVVIIVGIAISMGWLL